MAILSDLKLTLTQTEAQRTLHLVDVSYAYTLTCTSVECERNLSFDIAVDVVGDDVVADDLLAQGIDRHIVECDSAPIVMARSFLVGQSLLDEDIGGDEIKLRVRARDSAGDEIVGTTGIVRGHF